MAELVPYPFAALLRRMLREPAQQGTLFDLPLAKIWRPAPDTDLSVAFHSQRAANPLGPAAGPQTQMAQNIVLSWLAGCRIFELKTVQIMDELDIPRPCIDMQTIGYNIEWSQELKLQQSLHEYVKAAMLIGILRAQAAAGDEALAGLDGPAGDLIFDMSVGYDLEGIQTPQVQAFIDGIRDCADVVEQLRAEIPDDYAEYRDLDYPTSLSHTLTLSTFHGCPPDEIERIIHWLLTEKRLDCIVKLNPTLLGPERMRELLHDQLGYTELNVPQSAFDNDTKWHQVEAFVERLGATADGLGLSFGVKFTNTLITTNHRDFFPGSEKEMYASGEPLHVLAINLVQKFRQRFGDHYPISFSAGIDRKNFADAVALGLTPITTCSDLCRPGGYARTAGYFKDLAKRMSKVGATTVDTWVLKAYGQAAAALATLDVPDDVRGACLAALDAGDDPCAAAGAHYDTWMSAVRVLNSDAYVAALNADPRYTRAKTNKPPRKIGSMLELFDCVTCDKCIPVCPNNANFKLDLPPRSLPIVKARAASGGRFEVVSDGATALEMKHQIANFADFCNECGNCDIFCPEDGGPYILKPRFFSTEAEWRTYASHDGFALARAGDAVTMHGRFEGREVVATFGGDGRVAYTGDGFEVKLSLTRDAASDVTGTSSADEVDLTYLFIMDAVRGALMNSVNYVESLLHD